MDQIKIGKFIAQCRKDRGMTQLQLAEKLGITDRAVSKWETGKSMPDVGIIPELCQTLDITVNDLLSGEKVSSEQYSQKLEAKLLELIGEKENSDNRTLHVSMLMLALIFFLLLACQTIMQLMGEEGPLVIYFAILAVVLFAYYPLFLILRNQRTVGKFQCPNCGHTYMPGFWRMLIGLGGLRKLRTVCPECKKRGWHPRVYVDPEMKNLTQKSKKEE